MKATELIEYIKRWNLFCEHITLSTIFAKIPGSDAHVINYGPPGSGKSRSTHELLQELNLGTDILVDNTTTDRGLFETFLNYPEQDIIMDECSTLLKNRKAQDMCKMSMERKPLTWTKNDSTETTDPYIGNLIINTNVKIDETVSDRTFVNKTTSSKEVVLAFNQHLHDTYFKKQNFEPFFKHIRQVINDRKPVQLTKEEFEYVYNLVKENLKEINKEGTYSRRILKRELAYFTCAKKLFGGLTNDVKSFIEPFAITYISNTNAPGLIEGLLGNGPMEKADLVKLMSKEGGYTEQHARRIVNKSIYSGDIVLKGKIVEMNVSNISNANISNT